MNQIICLSPHLFILDLLLDDLDGIPTSDAVSVSKLERAEQKRRGV